MRIANYNERAALLVGPRAEPRVLDIAAISDGRFGPDLPALYRDWADFLGWTASLSTDSQGIPLDRRLLGAPSPSPRQVFAVGLNYHAHAAESGFASPTDLPPVFTKYVSAFTGPDTEVTLPEGGNVDWEVELVVVIGREGRRVDASAAWGHVAGLTVGQDISERVSQLRGPAPQFGLGKSFPGFAPQGPWLVTPDEFDDPGDLELGCTLDGEEVQKGRTRDLIFDVPALISALSRTVTLYPGDVVFTGTPSGVGVGRDPQRFVQPGQRLHSWIEGIGELNQTFRPATETE
ncbi:2-keto-4-pentenoate hydratase/2-oxohepta-3-ene-1,7-dioic acid hydratase in catechol pathway [Nocardia tenerifensis]|uniref:2-keto-4-pentenoate hydratase/2-oxohepta-3-ene-1,7-dioic acid hydratase in catechol pathway n=1 Tax=Nocardia tenerifensis TaxID=228006 RepID=A0A318KH62_9NOCA|nr:fumarylacetoacetate hydrolase family protein [Nocardia tenerifensis]PXX71513.1 2-keto-4-pentenoate hydratase/2-oxohepta-3-ene-1,7-dioic acid hydratase in catechol pathway [Nocardia tenerifensis]